MQPRTLVLNPWGSPNRVASWEGAVTLVVVEKARVELSYEVSEFGLITSQHLSMPVPAVIRLSRNTPRDKTSVKFSRPNMLARDNWKCCYCPPHLARKSARELTYDHVVPRARGGKTTWGNIVMACRPHNLQKGHRTAQEAGMKMHWKPFTPKKLSLSAPLLIEASKIHPLWIPYLRLSQDAQATA